MSRTIRSGGWLGVGLLLVTSAASGRDAVARPMLAAAVPPKVFGTDAETITVVSGMAFRGLGAFQVRDTLSVGFWYCNIPPCDPEVDHYYTSLELPAGSVIDYIGVNSASPGDGALGFTLHKRDADNLRTTLASYTIPGHTDFRTDYTGPLGISIPENAGHAYVLDIEHPLTDQPGSQIGYIEVYWKRTVSSPPAAPTFSDVPSSHPFFQFIEALASSGITGGCGGGNYCPDDPLTRGQMAVFLAKALGLHWAQ
jgi:hypothetical protein